MKYLVLLCGFASLWRSGNSRRFYHGGRKMKSLVVLCVFASLWRSGISGPCGGEIFNLNAHGPTCLCNGGPCDATCSSNTGCPAHADCPNGYYYVDGARCYCVGTYGKTPGGQACDVADGSSKCTPPCTDDGICEEGGGSGTFPSCACRDGITDCTRELVCDGEVYNLNAHGPTCLCTGGPCDTTCSSSTGCPAHADCPNGVYYVDGARCYCRGRYGKTPGGQVCDVADGSSKCTPPCTESGVCEEGAGSGTEPACACMSGVTGCTIDPNCMQHTCLNDDSCVPDPANNSFTCSACPEGMTGPKCHVPIC